MIDELDAVRLLRPPTSGPSPALVQRRRAELMEIIQEVSKSDSKGAKTHRARRLTTLRLLAAAVILAVGLAGAWAVMTEDPVTATRLYCAQWHGEQPVIGSGQGRLDGEDIMPASGDPVADCAAVWQKIFGYEAPKLIAYVSPDEGILVMPADQDPPAGQDTRLPDDFRQDLRLVELKEELADISRGLAQPGCHSLVEAKRVVATQLERLRLGEWSIRQAGEGNQGCTYNYYLDTENQVVVLNRGPAFAYEKEDVELARRLTAQLVEGPHARCLTVAEAVALTRQELAELELEAGYLFGVVDEGESETPTCARPTTSPAIRIRAVPRSRS